MELVMNGVTAVFIAELAEPQLGGDRIQVAAPLLPGLLCSRLSVVPPCATGVALNAPCKETP